MFKSKFSSALTCMMSGALGMANAESKLSVGYGAEAGAMNASLQSFVRKHCRDSLVICRNKPSRQVLGNLGIRTTAGTDTAWTFDPSPLEVGHELLTQAGWDGQTPLLAVCPINPFWWPVKPDLVKAVANKIAGQYKGEHYKSIYFHQYSEEKKAKNRAYLAGIAQAVNAFAGEQKVFPILVGMEQLDRLACESLQPLLDMEAPLFISDTYDMYQMVSVLRNCAMMVSSRFHAIVTSMPGLVASAGITMDERIRNLMNDRNHPDLFLEVDDEDLGDKLLEILRRLHRDREQIADDIGRVIPQQLELMGQMGIDFEDEVLRVYPEFERRNVPRSWEHYLPELPPTIDALMEKYA
jgi:polysaccharide pyruvyl transferase WcaK-like protein